MRKATFGFVAARRPPSSVVIVNPDPPPPGPGPSGNLVTLGSATYIHNTLKGWTSVHQQQRDSVSKVAIGDTAEIQNQHLVGFGASVDVEVKILEKALTSNVVTLYTTDADGWSVGQKINVVGLGAPFDGTDLVITGLVTPDALPAQISYAKTAANVARSAAASGAVARNFTFLDQTFGYPTKTTGYFSNSQYLCLTACGCPNYMKTPPSGSTPNPMGTPSAASQSDMTSYVPPHWSYFPAFGDTIAACVARYADLTHIQVWNENKGFYITTQSSTSSIVPAGSGLVADTTLGGNNNRWWTEGNTAMYNYIWDKCKAVRSSIFIVGPYCVYNSFAGLTNSTDWSNDAFPLNLQGPWGYSDKKVLAHLMYFIKYCHGTDAICVDYRNLQKDSSVANFYNPASVPATPDPTNAFLSNPDGGAHARYWKEGYNDGAWTNGQRLPDLVAWLRALGASSTAYQRSVCDARTVNVWYAEWYAYSNREQFKHANPATGQYYTHPTSTWADDTAAWAWGYVWTANSMSECAMGWKPEGTVQGNVVDPGDSNPLALYKDNDPSTAGRTPLYTVGKALKDYFPKGTQMYAFTSNMPTVWGFASNTMIMLVNRDPNPITFTLVNPKNTTPPTITLSGYEVRFLAR
ncbi:MAG TPA: hypothetical protein VIJ87_06285 [Pyrinomonadaceae bacterium]